MQAIEDCWHKVGGLVWNVWVEAAAALLAEMALGRGRDSGEDDKSSYFPGIPLP